MSVGQYHHSKSKRQIDIPGTIPISISIVLANLEFECRVAYVNEDDIDVWSNTITVQSHVHKPPGKL